ncbi:MAG: molybdopterin-dependent oxidoreductase [Acidobacteria bacterium]|nr:molybdopterin-dependent oxidoreductase [Acidobacteriota bacterium]
MAKKTGMIVRAARPEDLEMPLEFFSDYLTPAEHFFVRTHTYVPRVSPGEYKLEVAGEVSKPLALSMTDIRKLPRVELVSVLECAGNGRSLYAPPMPGLQWSYGAVGNAKWAGVRLGDVLKQAGVKPAGREVLFDGLDVGPGTMPDFQRTIPVKKALDPNTLLAYEMNGRTLPLQHGFPLRVIAPGWASDSWVKWLAKITVLDHDFDGFFMKTAYRHPGKPVRPGEAVPPEKMSPVTSLRVKSVISTPADGATVAPGGVVKVAGAAWSGDGGPVESVEVSADGGRTWRAAAMISPRTPFGWRLWSFDWRPAREQFHTLMARAKTAAGDIQPFAQEWNPSGYQWNVVHKVGVNVSSQPAPAAQPAGPVDVSGQPAGYRSSCLVCHGDDVVTQQRLTRGQWEKEVDKMGRWGARVKPEDREALLDYLMRISRGR